MRHPFSRSYGVNLPSSLARFLSSTLGYSPHPPVSVWGTVLWYCPLEVFLGSVESKASPGPKAGSTSALSLQRRIFLSPSKTYNLVEGQPSPSLFILLRHSISITSTTEYRNINLFPIDYAFRPRLRDRLTLRGFALRRNPWVYGVPDSHRHYRYSCLHSHFLPVQCSLRYIFAPTRTLLYR